MWIVSGFAALGFLIGILVGLTAHSVVTSVLTLVFAFAGGSVMAFLAKLTTADRRIAGQMIFALSLSCVLGTYVGIATSEWHLLSPDRLKVNHTAGLASSPVPSSKESGNCNVPALQNKYLDSAVVSEATSIDLRYRNGDLKGNPREAYQLLYDLFQESTQEREGGHAAATNP